MLLRYHWGLGVGHTYSHTQDSVPHSMATRTPHTSQGELDDLEHIDSELDPFGDSASHSLLDGFADLDNDFSVSELDALEWQLPETGKASSRVQVRVSDKRRPNKFFDFTSVNASTSEPLVHGFDDLGAGLSLGELDALEWEAESVDDGGDNDVESVDELEDDPNNLEMYEMYGPDWDNCSDESD